MSEYIDNLVGMKEVLPKHEVEEAMTFMKENEEKIKDFLENNDKDMTGDIIADKCFTAFHYGVCIGAHKSLEKSRMNCPVFTGKAVEDCRVYQILTQDSSIKTFSQIMSNVTGAVRTDDVSVLRLASIVFELSLLLGWSISGELQ